MGEREEKLRELIAKLEKQGCYCDVRAGWSCPMHGYLREVEALLAEPQPAPPSLSADWPECEEFYNLMQAYRHEPVVHVVTVKQNYEAIKSWLRNCLSAAKPVGGTVGLEQREAELRDSVLEEAAKIARTHFLQYTGDNVATMELVQAIRALKSQVSVKGQCHSLSACLCCYGTVRAHAAVKQHCQFCERPTSQVSVTGASHDK